MAGVSGPDVGVVRYESCGTREAVELLAVCLVCFGAGRMLGWGSVVLLTRRAEASGILGWSMGGLRGDWVHAFLPRLAPAPT